MGTRTIVRQFVRDFLNAFPKSVWEHRKGVGVFMVAAFLGLAGVTVAGWEAMNSPAFCGSCHNMEPYAESWRESAHSEVSCTECHLPPGFWNHIKYKMVDGLLSGVYFITGKGPSKAHAIVASEACEICHTREELSRDAFEYRGAMFEHGRHLGDLGNGIKAQCTTCHEQNTTEKHISVSDGVCFQCHLMQTAENDPFTQCTICHVSPSEEILVDGKIFPHGRYIERGGGCLNCHSTVVQAEQLTPTDKCLNCHGQPEILNHEFSVEEVHSEHINKHKTECFRCHGLVSHELVEKDVGTSHQCDTCHPSLKMHSIQEEMYLGKGAIGVESIPFRMYNSHIECSGCHAATGTEVVKREDFHAEDVGNACVDCHGQYFDKMLSVWQEVLKESINETTFAINKAKGVLAKASADAETLKKAKILVGQAETNRDFVLKAKGIHNLEYALQALQVAKNKSVEANNMVSSKKMAIYGPVKTDCTVCHDYMTKIDVQLVDISFPHDVHVDDEDLDCQECHSDRMDHGVTRFENCADCHHEDGDISCVNCHSNQHALFSGEGPARVPGPASFKAELDLGCEDCHAEIRASGESGIDMIATQCVDCHDDESKGKLAKDWVHDGKELTKGLEERLVKARALADECLAKGINVDVPLDLIGCAEKCLTLVNKGNAVHNLEYSKLLVADSIRNIEAAMVTLKKKLDM